jgi:CelD/BcsL family acetyltransferase involved in cellulose biosynthesis
MQLPGNFDAFLAARPPRIRSNLRRRLRIAEREGLEAHPAHAGARAAAIDAFVRLHRERARAKREAHPNIDWRLAELLVRLGEHQTPRLSVMTLQRDGDAIAVGLAMEQGTADWFYNFGFDPSVAKLSPGVVLGLASIRAAIARGATRCDFGPGDARYKRDLGGEPVPRIRLEATSASLSGQVHRAGAVVRRQMRDVSVVREAREKGLRVTAPSRTARDGMLTPSWRSHRHPG